MKLSVDRTRLRKEVHQQRKSMKKLRETIVFYKRKTAKLSITFTETSAISKAKIKTLEQQVISLMNQKQALINRNKLLTDQNRSIFDCFDFTGDIDNTVVSDDSKPIAVEVEDVEKNKTVQTPQKPKKRKRKTSVRKSIRNKK